MSDYFRKQLIADIDSHIKALGDILGTPDVAKSNEDDLKTRLKASQKDGEHMHLVHELTALRQTFVKAAAAATAVALRHEVEGSPSSAPAVLDELRLLIKDI
ncbi:hypothetical protein [Pseudomonas mandelii]|uniref:hypothetical protein n=1 Tax=Pseudomonas mandelii TaxID=75612 RepID=UPI003C718783